MLINADIQIMTHTHKNTQHPYLHSIEMVDYLVDHQLLVMVQPLIQSGSLKDMIYKVYTLL